MSENSKKIILDGSKLTIKNGDVVYNDSKKDFKTRLNESVGGKTYSSLSKAIKDVEKDLR